MSVLFIIFLGCRVVPALSRSTMAFSHPYSRILPLKCPQPPSPDTCVVHLNCPILQGDEKERTITSYSSTGGDKLSSGELGKVEEFKVPRDTSTSNQCLLLPAPLLDPAWWQFVFHGPLLSNSLWPAPSAGCSCSWMLGWPFIYSPSV